MKETVMLLGFGMGLVAGALLYKYCQPCQDAIKKGEKAVMKEVESLTSKAKQAQKKAKK